jgi:hypothetical protein
MSGECNSYVIFAEEYENLKHACDTDFGLFQGDWKKILELLNIGEEF